jgi:hypothetical protein
MTRDPVAGIIDWVGLKSVFELNDKQQKILIEKVMELGKCLC